MPQQYLDENGNVVKSTYLDARGNPVNTPSQMPNGASLEVTPLSDQEETRFRTWAQANKIPDVDDPQSFYDYRGYWKEFGDKPIQYGIDHFTDTYKQHGHPTFSIESKYSKGANDGGRWEGEKYISPGIQAPVEQPPSLFSQGINRLTTPLANVQEPTMDDWMNRPANAAWREGVRGMTTPLGILGELAGGIGLVRGLRGAKKASPVLERLENIPAGAKPYTPPVDDLFGDIAEMQGNAILTGERLVKLLGVGPKEAIQRGWAIAEGNGYRVIQNRPDLQGNPFAVGGKEPQVLGARINPETKLFQRNPFSTNPSGRTEFSLPTQLPASEQMGDLTSKLRNGETKVFDTLDEVIKNINSRTDWSNEKKALVEARILQKEIDAQGNLPLDPGIFGKINANAKTLLTLDAPGFSSAIGRQGLPLIRTRAYWNSLDDMFKAYGSSKANEAIKEAVFSKPLFKETFTEEGKRIASIAEQAGLDLHYDERFARSWIQRNVAPFRANERAYEAFILKLRTDHFETLYNQAKAAGLDVRPGSKVLSQLADTINVATGKGGDQLAKATEAIKIGSFAPLEMFAPRYVQSRFEMLNPMRMLDPSLDPMVRKENIKNFLALSAASITMNGLYKIAGAQVGTDPTSSDFMKSKFGKVAADPNAGVQQPLVLGSRLINGLMQTMKEGQVSKFGQAVGRDYAAQFLTSRLAPVQSFLAAAMLNGGKDFDNQPFEWKQAIINRATPIMLQDIMDIYKENPNLLPLVIPAMAGQGVNVYTR